MKKLFLILVLFTISVPHIKAGTITRTYHFDSPAVSLNNGFSTVNFSNTRLTGKTGEPLLPWKSVMLLLPPGEKAVSIEVRGRNPVTVQGSFTLFPAQPSRPYSSQREHPFYQDTAVYNQNRYPGNPSGPVRTGVMNGFSFAMAVFTPVTYNPARGIVSFYRDVDISVTTRACTDRHTALPARPALFTRASGVADNPGQAVLYRSMAQAPAGTYDVLIITHQTFADSLGPLSESYIQRGLESRIITTDSIESVYEGRDLQEKMRNCIIEAYETNGISHVLLCGDSEFIPYRGLYCYVQSDVTYESNDIPSDIYYAALDGTWNTDNDDRWGEEGEEDLLPELSVGRIPASDFTELRNIIHKTVMYQQHPVAGEQRKALFVGEKLWADPETWGGDYLDLLVGLKEDNGYTTNGIPEDFSITKVYDKTASWTKEMLIPELDKGWSGIHHSGHSSYSYNMRLSLYDIAPQMFPSVDGISHNFTYIYSNGCYSAAFDRDLCISEKMLVMEPFAFAYIGNSRYGWFNEGQTEGPSVHLHREFVHALYSDSAEFIGTAHTMSKIATAPWVTSPDQWEEGALRWCMYSCNVLGDPAARLWTDEPVQAGLVHLGLTDSDSVFQVSVSASIQNTGGISCLLLQDNRVIARASTGKNGTVRFSFSTGDLHQGIASVTAAGRNIIPVEKQLLVQSSSQGPEYTDPVITALYPSPAIESATIIFYTPDESSGTITVYNILGRPVKTFTFSGTEKALLSRVWDLRTDQGLPVAPGMYICRLNMNGKHHSKKVVVLR